MPERAPWIDTAFGEPPQVAAVTALPNPNEEPYFVPPHQPHLNINNELLPPTQYAPKTMADETVGATTDPFHASKEAAYALTYNPLPVMAPPALQAYVDRPYGDAYTVGRGMRETAQNAARERATPDYGEDAWNAWPKLPQPDAAHEIIPATGYSAQTMPDEKAGSDVTPYYFAATPAPEATFNPYPVGPELSIKQIVDEKLA